MTSADMFYLIASIGIIVITVFISLAYYRVVKTLNNLDNILLGVKGITDNIQIIKSGVKIGIFSLISGIANRLRIKKNNSKEVKNND